MPRPVQGGLVHVSTPSGVTSPLFTLRPYQQEMLDHLMGAEEPLFIQTWGRALRPLPGGNGGPGKCPDWGQGMQSGAGGSIPVPVQTQCWNFGGVCVGPCHYPLHCARTHGG